MKTTFALASVLSMFACIVSAQEGKATTYRFWQSGKTYIARAEVPGRYSVWMTYYVSTDGVNFEQTRQDGLLSTMEVEEIDFSVPATGQKGVLHLENNILTVNGKPFRSIVLDVARLKFLPFPYIRVPYVLLQASSGEYVLVTTSKYAESSSEIKLFVGSAANMQEVPLMQKSFTRCGAFLLQTAQGWLKYHTPDADEPSLWLDAKVKPLTLSDFVIVEKGATATLKPKH